MLEEFFGWPDRFLGGVADRYVESLCDGYNLTENETEYILETRVPGLTKEDLQIKMDQGDLLIKTIWTEEEKLDTTSKVLRRAFKKPKFSQRIVLPRGYRKTGIQAKVQNGILTIKVPKEAPSDSGDIEIL